MPWMEGGGRLLLPFVGDNGGLWVGTTGGRVRRWWVLWTPFVGAIGEGRSPLVGVGDGRLPLFVLPRCVLRLPLAGDGGGCSCSPSPSFVSPGCALPFAIGGGCSPPLVSADGGGCSCSPSPSFVSPGCALPFAVGGGCLCPPLVGDGGGRSPPFAPLVVCSPLFVWPVTIVACRGGCVCWWGLVRRVWDERAYLWLKDGQRTTYPSSFVVWSPRRYQRRGT